MRTHVGVAEGESVGEAVNVFNAVGLGVGESVTVDVSVADSERAKQKKKKGGKPEGKCKYRAKERKTFACLLGEKGTRESGGGDRKRRKGVDKRVRWTESVAVEVGVGVNDVVKVAVADGVHVRRRLHERVAVEVNVADHNNKETQCRLRKAHTEGTDPQKVVAATCELRGCVRPFQQHA